MSEFHIHTQPKLYEMFLHDTTMIQKIALEDDDFSHILEALACYLFWYVKTQDTRDRHARFVEQHRFLMDVFQGYDLFASGLDLGKVETFFNDVALEIRQACRDIVEQNRKISLIDFIIIDDPVHDINVIWIVST